MYQLNADLIELHNMKLVLDNKFVNKEDGNG